MSASTGAKGAKGANASRRDRSRRASWRPLWIGALGIAGATLVRWPFEPWLHGRAPFAFYYVAILYVAWSSGVIATIVATLLSLAVAKYLFIPVEHSFELAPDEWKSLLVFLIASAAMIVLSRKASALRMRAERDAAACKRAERGARAALWEWNASSREFESAALAGLFGLPVDEPRIGIERYEQVVHDEDRARFRAGLELARTSAEPCRLEFRIVHATKGVRWFAQLCEASTSALDGDCVAGITIDVTERVVAEQASATQREWLETTLASIGDAVIATDVQGRVTFMNPVAELLTGSKLADASGCDCAQVFHIVDEQTRERVESPVARVLRDGVVVGLANHTVLVARDGVERPIDDSGAPIRAPDGRIVGVVLVFRDVSERRAIERDKQLVAQEREHLLAAERAARTEAERANRLKDEFVSTLSHELRTPLNALVGWVHILRQTGATDPERLRQGLDVIDRNTRLQVQLVDDLLDIGRVLSGKLLLDVRRVDVEPVLDAALDAVKRVFEAKRIELVKAIEPTPPIAADPMRLQQIIWNLLSNAGKFTPDGGRVEIRVRRVGANAEISVCDDGIGIRRELLPQVFERFRQGDGSLRRRFGGLGLGLAIVKQLTEMHGGSVVVESEGEGRGATFHVRLPCGGEATSALPRPAPDAARERVADGAIERLKGLCVLVAEDDADARAFVVRILEDCGAEVLGAASAPDALQRLAERRVDVLVCDIGMPGMDGYAMLQQIRRSSDERLASMPAIALTAFARPEDRAQALRSGFDAHLAKPVEPTELIAAVASFGGRAAARVRDVAREHDERRDE